MTDRLIGKRDIAAMLGTSPGVAASVFYSNRRNHMTTAPQTCERLLRPADVMRLLGIKKTKLYSCIKSGRIPEPQRLTSRSVCWPESSIKAIVEDIKTGQLVL